MGWNSWDCFGAAVTETQTMANADYMAEHLKMHGWQYIVVDIQWYEPLAEGWDYRPNAKLKMDEYGRLLPAGNRFSSAANGNWVQIACGLCPFQGSQIWNSHASRDSAPGRRAKHADLRYPSAGKRHRGQEQHLPVERRYVGRRYLQTRNAQEYYDALFQQYAAWGIDFIKVDDLSRPYHAGEINAIRNAIDRCGHPIIFSTSPGATPLRYGSDIAAHANMWRISDDFWDRWQPLKEQFRRCADSAPFCGTGHYPDADMLPLGAIRASEHGHTGFTREEQYTVMTLWAICRSPLMFGGNLPQTDEFTLSLLSNDEVLAVDQPTLQAGSYFGTTI